MDILLYFGGPALIAFLIQFLVGCRTQHKILRYIPIYCFVITLAFAIIALTSDSGFFLGGNVIPLLYYGLLKLVQYDSVDVLVITAIHNWAILAIREGIKVECTGESTTNSG